MPRTCVAALRLSTNPNPNPNPNPSSYPNPNSNPNPNPNPNPNQDAGPLAEVQFWSSRTIDLSGIHEQLERPEVIS